jgi:hypothetical protein
MSRTIDRQQQALPIESVLEPDPDDATHHFAALCHARFIGDTRTAMRLIRRLRDLGWQVAAIAPASERKAGR